MCVINVVIKTIALVPINNMLRRCLPKYSLECTMMVAFSPIYFVWSRLLMAENLLAPLLIICILYHICYHPRNRAEVDKKTVFAALLGLSLIYTKYLTIVLMPIFCLYWSWELLRRGYKNICNYLKVNVFYTLVVVCGILLYSIVYSISSKTAWSFEVVKATIGLDSGGSSPGTVGYSLLIDEKWLVCYLCYMVLGAGIQIALIMLLSDVGRVKKEVIFLLWISVALCYVAARHSSLVSYNEGYRMHKLLGRYVAYFLPICIVLLFLTMSHKVSKRRVIASAISVPMLMFLSYLVLYERLLWNYEEGWLGGVRGWENVGFLHMGILLCAIYCVTAVIVAILFVRKKVRLATIIVCCIMSINSLDAVVTAEEQNPYMAKCRDINEFLEVNGDMPIGVICSDYNRYNDMLGLYVYFSDNPTELSMHTVDGIYYSANSRPILSEQEYYYMLPVEDVDTELYKDKDVEFFSEENSAYIFIKWDKRLFSKCNREIDITRGENNVSIEFTASDNALVVFGEGMWPIEPLAKNMCKVNVTYPFERGNIYSFAIYDFTTMEMFTYDMKW